MNLFKNKSNQITVFSKIDEENLVNSEAVAKSLTLYYVY